MYLIMSENITDSRNFHRSTLGQTERIGQTEHRGTLGPTEHVE